MSSRNAFLSACVLVICCVVPMSGQQPAASTSSRSNVVVPPLVNYSSVLTDVNGKPLTLITGVTFLLYKEEQGGAPLWMETQNVYPDKTGHYSVMLGSTTSTGLPADIFVAGQARWLGVQPQGQPDQPRVLLLSVPYALKAVDAQTVGGLPASAFVLAAPPTGNATSTASPSGAAQPLATGTTPVTTAGGTINKLAKFDATADITNSQIFDNGTNVGIGNTSPAAKLDVSGAATVRGLLSLPATGTATATAGKNSQAIGWTASAFNGSTTAAVNQNFRWQAEPVGNNTASPSATLNLLFGVGTIVPAETGLKISSKGLLTFASGQTFPGTGAITGVTAGTNLTGGGNTGTVTLNVDTTKVPQLVANNAFTGNQSIAGNLSATGKVGIGTPAPAQNLDVSSGNAMVRGVGNFKAAGNTAFLYLGDTQHPIEAIWNTGLAMGAYKVPQAFFIQDGTGDVGIGTTTPAYKLDVHGTGNFSGPVNFASGQTVSGSVSASQLISTVASGTPPLQVASTTLVPNLNANYLGGFAAGGFQPAGSYASLGANTFTATQTISSGDLSVSNGNLNLSGVLNIGGVPFVSVSGTNDIAIGPGAFGQGSGKSNIAIGPGAFNQGSGDSNVAIGAYAAIYYELANDNTVIGANAGLSGPEGGTLTSVTFVGFNAGPAPLGPGQSPGVTNDTAIGASSQVYLLSKNDTAIGANTNVNATDNATAIGANAEVDANNALVLGSINGVNGATASTKVGIGTTTPSNVLTIAQNAGHAIADGWDTYSSRRWKTNIHTLHGALGKVEQLRGVSYDLKANGRHEVGVIAEEVGAVVPEVVAWEKNGTYAQSVDYGRLTALLIEATKEQQTLIQKQQAQIKVQQMQIQAERKRGDVQQARVSQLISQVKAIEASLKTNNGADPEVRTAKARGTTVRQ